MGKIIGKTYPKKKRGGNGQTPPAQPPQTPPQGAKQGDDKNGEE